MIHFASTLNLKSNVNPHLPRRSDSLNATQTKAPSHKILLTIEEELHDARRVHSHGQEEDLRAALNMVIERLSEVSSMLSEAYKTQADLEVQLNVAKSNLQLVISNNEMLEEALKRDTSGNPKDVGWRRASARESKEINSSRPSLSESGGGSAAEQKDTPASTPTSTSPVIAPSPNTTQETSRFFRFRFTSGSSPNPAGGSRPATPQLNDAKLHLNSPSLPTLPSLAGSREKEIEEELEKERGKRKKAEKEKEELEAELESLSQALFEEANKMVATERIKHADTQEELKEAQLEKEALRSALRLLEMENSQLTNSTTFTSTSIPVSSSEPALSFIHSSPLQARRRRSSSQFALKSIPGSPNIPYTSLDASQAESEPAQEVDADAPPPRLPLTPFPRDVQPPSPSPSPSPELMEAEEMGSAALDPSEDGAEGDNNNDRKEEKEEEFESEPTPQVEVARFRPPSLPLSSWMEGSPWADVPSLSRASLG